MDSNNYIHKIKYYKYNNQIVGIIPSMDKAFWVKEGNVIPTGIISKEKPIFHESYSRKQRVKRVFVLTDACNLQCSYCFEGKHVETKVMDDVFVEKNIYEMFQEAKRKNTNIISFSLFGGEPTMNWKAIEKAITVSKMLEEDTGIRCYKAIVTNGVMSKDKIKYLIDNLDYIYFSLDGPKELFLKQRKPYGGNYVYDIIFDNAQEVYKSGVYLAFKITVTSYTIDCLKEIEDFFTYNFPTCSRLYQPCMVEENDELYISFGEFLTKFYELKNYTIFDRNIATSLYKNKPSDRFCNLAIRNVVYPDGNVLACHRSNMCIKDDEVSKTFKVGICDKEGTINYLSDKQEYMKKFNVLSIESCNECPFRYHCCGGCPTIKLLSGNKDMFRKADYCEDFIKYTLTNIYSRLNKSSIEYIKDIPETYIPQNEYLLEYDKFLCTCEDSLITIEE